MVRMKKNKFDMLLIMISSQRDKMIIYVQIFDKYNTE